MTHQFLHFVLYFTKWVLLQPHFIFTLSNVLYTQKESIMFSSTVTFLTFFHDYAFSVLISLNVLLNFIKHELKIYKVLLFVTHIVFFKGPRYCPNTEISSFSLCLMLSFFTSYMNYFHEIHKLSPDL